MARRLDRCPHCGEFYDDFHYATHRRTCLQDPDILDAIRRLADDGTGRAINRAAYRELPDKPVSDDHIARTFGSWREAMQRLGLLPPPRQRNDPLNAPLSDAERFACRRRYDVECAYYPSK